MVTSGRHYNDGCCFDYGNAEVDNNDDKAGIGARVQRVVALHVAGVTPLRHHGGYILWQLQRLGPRAGVCARVACARLLLDTARDAAAPGAGAMGHG